ncbi:MAG: glutamate 5-kinase [Demequinaceae bacterium]|nr:glutamate 5-kinase [Demequinaceae bacterium]
MTDVRQRFVRAGRMVVKIGSSSLTGEDGFLDEDALVALVDVLAEMHRRGKHVLLVTSGSIASGLAPLGLKERPRDLATAQATASVGQGLLIASYTKAFARHGIRVGQVLLTSDDLVRRTHYGNARRALERLLKLDVVPIVNENDTVATDEIRFGDNDRLAALVTTVVHAEALLLLTDVDALHSAAPGTPGARRIERVDSPKDLEGIDISHRGHVLGTGGMVTKLEAAQIATGAGAVVLLTSARNALRAVDGEDVGTLFAPTGKRSTSRLQWLATVAKTCGQIVLDEGAAQAVLAGKASLLAAGATAVRGDFKAGEAIELVGPDGVPVARAFARFPSHQIPAMLGLSTKRLREELGEEYARELVHVDDLVIVRRAK